MKACASVGARLETGAMDAAAPVVLVEGVFEPRLSVAALHVRGPLDEREATLHALEPAGAGARTDAWAHREAVVALPHRLSDETQRWSVLARGVLTDRRRTRAAGIDEDRWVVRDRWTRALAAAPTVWWASRDGALQPLAHGVLEPGGEGNRSARRFDIHGERVHVLQAEGLSWSVGDALAMLSALGRLGLSVSLLPHELRAAPLLARVDLSRPVGEALRRVVEPYGLVVRRELWRAGHTVVERRQVRASHHGRRIRLRWGQREGSLAEVLRIDHAAVLDAAQRWEAHASGWQIEATFALVGGWDPALEGADDSEYARGQSSDFARYANVYRHWALNEDGRYSASPYERGDPFDLAAFFSDSRVRSQALRFLPCVTLDDAGRARPPVVEVSADGGATWSQYGGRAVIAMDRAAVRLDDDVLPSAFLQAAKSGTARVRVTATLQNPQPVRRTRWRGNAFAGARPPRVLPVGDAFGFRRVAGESVHRPAVEAGELATRSVDDTRSLEVWLVRRMDEAARRAGASLQGRGRVDLAGTWPWLRVGDRLVEAGGATRGPTGEAEAIARRGVVIDGMELHFGVSAHAGPRTVAHVRF